MAKLPRVLCPVCNDPVAGVPTRRLGMLSVHDHKRTPRALVLCPGSMTHVPAADAIAVQEELPEPAAERAEAPTLF
ncbi:hypothetical protein [Streptomyces sp. NPDC057740]|uniref:hypothetical protein n=1 Tax=Streptomyces sp. NPDC057740 TaxID=3346234 RepID=UPI00367C9636